MSRSFTAAEDALIIHLRERENLPWHEIARQVSAFGIDRTRDGVRIRYFFHLSPNRPIGGRPVGRRGKQRACMHADCRKLFWSQHAGVRFCGSCRNDMRDGDNCMAPLSFGHGVASARPVRTV